MNRQEIWDAVNGEHANYLLYLFERWQDERRYEDIHDYLEAIQKHLPQATKLSEDFILEFAADDGSLLVEYKIQGNEITVEGWSPEGGFGSPLDSPADPPEPAPTM